MIPPLSVETEDPNEEKGTTAFAVDRGNPPTTFPYFFRRGGAWRSESYVTH
jgi:hypothetical protein